MRFKLLRDQWFLVGVLMVTALTLGNPGGVVVGWGESFASVHGNEICLVLIFVLSGIDLEWSHLREALSDWQGVCLSLLFVFVVTPVIAWALSFAAPSADVALGLFIIGAVSTTQASGIVMATAAGGRAAHALLITIVGNIVCIFTIPITLSLLAGSRGQTIHLPWLDTMLKLAMLILLPLVVGMSLRRSVMPLFARGPLKPNHYSRTLILCILFIGLSKGRSNILGNGSQVFWAVGFSVVLHLLKAGVLWETMKLLGWKSGRRESVFFMGIQKTLPQAVWLQSAYFASHGMALVVCVVYHITQLVIDSWFVGKLAAARKASSPAST